MILKGSQRSGASKLATHLLRLDENDHVEVHELRGFSSSDLRSALREADAIAKGTRCRQFLFSLSFNPPETEAVSVAQFEAAIELAEERLGLAGQARAIVFHEKEGRRHAHVVWSRINVEEMKAINLPFYKRKLNGLAKELYLEHGWRLPDGLRDRGNRNPLNFTIAEWQQAKRVQEDARLLKVTFQECWAVSDNQAAFARALEEKGFVLARGDRRGYVALDYRGEVYSLPRWTGASTKELKAKLGDPANLPGVAATKEQIASRMTEKLADFIRETQARTNATTKVTLQRKAGMRQQQRSERAALKDAQAKRTDQEAAACAARFRTGLRGVWDWISGRTRKVKRENENEAIVAARRDSEEREKLTRAQLSTRRMLQQELRKVKREATGEMEDLRRDVALYMGWRSAPSHPPDRDGAREKVRSSVRAPGL